MSDHKPVIAMGFKEGAENGGPYVSHKRIMESCLQEKYDIQPLFFPKGRTGLFCPTFIKQFRAEIKRINPDIIQIPGLQLQGFHMMVAAILEKRKTVLAVHGSSREALALSSFKRLILKKVEDFTLKKATAIFAVSNYVENLDYIQKYKSKSFGTIYNLFSPKNYEKKDIRKELGISENDLVIVSTGRIIREKGFENLLEVLKSMNLSSHVKVMIAGDGNYLERMKSQAGELGNNIFFLGYRDDVDNILDAGDIFVILTWHETLCISLLEACQHAIPCIATNVGGIPEIIVDGRNGFLVEPNDNQAAAAALQKLIDDKQMRNEMGNNARADVESKFSQEDIINRLDEMYGSILNEYQLQRN